MSKKERQSKLIEIIKSTEIDTQEDLALALNNEGFVATQATLSRDIKDLKLIKVRGSTKKFRYSLPVESTNEQYSYIKLKSLFQATALSVESAQNLVVVKTLEGNGSACGMTVDKMNIHGVIGSVQGDDTLLIIAKDNQDANYIVDYLRGLLG